MKNNLGNIRLSARLEMSARMVGWADCVADIGCDHAHTDIWLLQNDRTSRCVAMDVRKGPLKKAEENLMLYGCRDMVELRLSDGLDGLKAGEAGCIIIAGMGGIVMRNILERGFGSSGHLNGSEPVLILQPQSHIYEVRKWLYENSYAISDEDMCREDGKYYFSMKAERVPEKAVADEPELHFGPVLLKRRPPVFAEYLRELSQKAKRRLSQIEISNSEDAALKKAYFENIEKMIGEFTWITSR